MLKRGALLACVLAVAGWRTPAFADDDAVVLMREPTDYTDVIDSFDEGDPIDVDLRIGFVRSRTGGTIRREVNGPTAADARGSFNFVDVAEHERLVNALELGVDVGLYRDLAAYVRVPVVLSDARSLSAPGGRSTSDVNEDLYVAGDVAQASSYVFQMPFTSPTRSGIGEVRLGLAWSILNQFRGDTHGTWVVSAEGTLPLGDPMVPCFDVAPAGREPCVGGTEPGLSDGVTRLKLETRGSYRYRYVEPYAGVSFQMGWPTASESWFAPSGDLAGYMNTLPPREAEMTLGIALVPWEHRGRSQRFAIDVRAHAAYVSEGRDYSPLFDALGTSASPYLTEPNLEAIPGGGVAPREVAFLGLTDTQAHSRLGARVALEMQAAKYVRFELGAGASYSTGHFITFSDACNPDVSPNGASDARIGSCRQGIINPHHRPVLDLPGKRFQLVDDFTFDVFASAVAQF